MAFLKPIGLRKTTADTPISLFPTDKKPLVANGVYVQSLPGNTGFQYLLSNSDAPDLTNYSNILLIIINGGDLFTDLSKVMTDIDLNTVFIAPSVDHEGAIVTLRIT